MPTIPISLTITGDTASSVVVETLVRGDTNATPAGVTLPIALTNSGSAWSGAFTDSSPPAWYYYTYRITWSDGTVEPDLSGTLSGSVAPVVGFWTSQALMERYLGSYLADQLSNVDNVTTTADPVGFTVAIGQIESDINYGLALRGYPTGATSPTFPTTSMAFGVITNYALIGGCYWLYNKRGVQDDKNKFTEPYMVAKADFQKVLRNKIPDVARGFISQPAVVMHGYGQRTPIPAGQIPQVP